MKHYVVTHPFVVSLPTPNSSEYRRYALTEPPQLPRVPTDAAMLRHQTRVEAFRGHRSGPFAKLEDAERACTAALATGCFYQVEIVSEPDETRAV